MIETFGLPDEITLQRSTYFDSPAVLNTMCKLVAQYHSQ